MNKSALIIVAAFATFVALYQSSCQAMDATDTLDSLKSQFLPPEYRNMNFTVDNVKKIYREKCKKVSGVDNSTLYQDIEKGATTLLACVSDVANLTALQDEIDKARPLGDLDSVFQKYCLKAPEAENCLRAFNEKLQPCLTHEEKQQNAAFIRVSTNLLKFMCSKGGGQIALFVAEEGPECFDVNKEAITHCMNKSFADFMPQNNLQEFLPKLFNVPQLLLQPEHCSDLDHFESCVMHYLERCNEITPANVVESVFRFVKNETNCKAFMEAKAKERPVLRASAGETNGAMRYISGFSVIMGTVCAVLLRAIFRGN